MLRTRLSDALKESMRAKDQQRLATLRLIMAAIKDKDIAARPAVMTGIGDDQILQLFNSMIKQRRESIELYEKGGRAELAKQEAAEIEVIQSFMPAQMDEAETAAAIKDAIAATGATSVKDMGKVMAVLKDKYTGRLDFSRASGAVKQHLGT